MESKRKQLFGKVFGARDRKASNDGEGFATRANANVNDFLSGGGGGDRLPSHPAPPPPSGSASHASTSGPPPLPRLNISQATRFPDANATEITSNPYQGTPLPRRRKGRKNLAVHFPTNPYPDVIGEGGDECEMPTVEISKRKRARGQSAPVIPPLSLNKIKGFPDGAGNGSFMADDKAPPPPTMGLRRAQTGFSEKAAVTAPPPPVPRTSKSLSAKDAAAKNENRRSFIEIHQAEMREAEGVAFAKARNDIPNDPPQREWEETREPILSPAPPPKSIPSPNPQSQEHPLPSMPPPPVPAPSSSHSVPPPSATAAHVPRILAQDVGRPSIEQSPASIHSVSSLTKVNSSSRYHQGQERRGTGSPPSPTRKSSKPSPSPVPLPLAKKTPSFSLHEVVSAAGDDALETFATRVRHLFAIFRLHAEQSRPVHTCSPEEFSRGSLWWFLKGRSGVEGAIRERPSSPESQRKHEMHKQQSFADLAKAYWMSEEMIPEITGDKWTPTESEIDEIRKSLVSGLRKLTMSMKRNGFMPSDEPFLAQTVDNTIWVEYPNVPQDLLALLSGSGGSLVPQRPTAGMDIIDTLPIADTTQFFAFGRVSVDAYLMEVDSAGAQRFHYPCYLSTIRPQKQPNLMFVIASQNGAVQLRIQGNKNVGPVWEDVKWRSEACALEIRLPRGFMLVIQCSPNDYRMLFGMWDFGGKVQSTLYPRPDEQVLFRSTLRGFQYFDADPQSRVFPKDPVSMCEVGLFERIHKENSPMGPRSFHRGYRLSIVTGPRTRTLSGVNHVYPSSMPVQFGFLRGEKDEPALVLRFESRSSKGRMVFSFNDDKERFRFHNLLSGTALHHDEMVTAEMALTGFTIGQSMTDNLGIQGFNHLAYKRTRVINEDTGGDEAPIVLADRLRVVIDFENGTLTDRINVGPGELRVRLDPRVPTALLLLRHPQTDMTVGVADGKTSKELAKELSLGIRETQTAQTVRTFRFANVKDLHAFETAVTGVQVLFDGIATAFAIARRRMVVPIHKKWEAGETRIQIVEGDGQVQILAFFEEFSHGHCMNFVLRGTDIYETFGRSGKSGLKIVDAKFPLPRMSEDVGEEAAFVCLDSPDYAGEHDDISILFDKDADRDRLAQCLPAPVKGSRSR